VAHGSGRINSAPDLRTGCETFHSTIDEIQRDLDEFVAPGLVNLVRVRKLSGVGLMLQCNMPSEPTSPALRLDLEDVLGSLQHARRTGDLGRLAFLIYWEVRKWARRAHKDALAALAADIVIKQPFPSRAAFLALADEVIDEMQRVLVGHG
jgi:hypothetical protein